MSLINDALKKAQQQRTEETPPVADTISSPFNESQAPAVPPAPPSPRRSPSPPPLAVQYNPPQKVPEKRKVSAVRYNPSSEEADEKEAPDSRMPSAQKTFWVTLGVIAVAAIAVRLTVTLTRSSREPTDEARSTEQGTTSGNASLSPQVAVPLPQPTLAMEPIAPPIPKKAAQPEPPSVAKTPGEPEPSAAVVFSAATAPAATKPATLAPAVISEQPATSPVNAEPAPTVSFRTQPALVTKTAAQPPAVESAPTPVSTPVVKAQPQPEPAPTVSLPAAKPAAAPVPPKPAPTVLPPLYSPRAPTPVNNSARVQNFIDRLRVSGVRISGRGSKVILNDRLFSAGDVVDPTLELKLTKIEDGVLTFTDTNGKNYLKLFQ